MPGPKKKPTTIYLDTRIARAARIKSALTGESLSDMVNDALAGKLRQDEEDIRLVRERAKEPARPYEDFLRELKRDGLI